MKRRTFLTASAAATSAFGLAACGSESTSTAELTKDTVGELNLSYWDKMQTATVEAGIKKFNEAYPNIKVTPSITAYKDYWTKLRTQAEGDNLPDVFWMNGPNIKLYASNDMLAPLDDLANVDWNDYPTALVDLYSVDGKHYGVPKDYDVVAVWCNKDLFAAAGVDLPQADWTWDDFRAICTKFKESGKGYGVVCDVIGGGQESYYNTIAQAGGFVIDGTKSGYDDPKTIEGLKIWAELIAEGSMPEIKVMTDTSPRKLFQAGQAAMFWAGSWEAGVMKEEFSKPESLVVVPLPKKEREATIIHGLAYVAAAKSAQLAAAKALVQVMTSEEIALVEATNGSAIPAFNGTQEAWTKLDERWGLEVYTEQAEKNSVAYPVSKNTAAWNEKENELLVPAFQGTTQVEDAATELASVMNELLAAE